MSPMRRRRHYWGNPRGGPARNRPMAGGPLTALRRAHRMMENGRHGEAAVIFERLAYGARDLGMELRAPNLFVKGALAYYLAGNPQMGMKLFGDGLGMLAQAGLRERLVRLGSRTVAELEGAGFHEDARAAQALLDGKLAGAAVEGEAGEPPGGQTGRLPATCPGCGAIVHADEVEWVDEYNAECAYCGRSLAG